MPLEAHFYHPRWPVLFEDNHLLALFKPAGLLAQGDRSGSASLLELAKGWLKERYGKPGKVFLGLVHRLDRPVAGVMVFARTSKAAARLSGQFRAGTVQKTYLAVVAGAPRQPEGRLCHHIARQGTFSRIVKQPGVRSRDACLRYRLMEQRGEHSLLLVEPQTGRKHQIRLQLSHAGSAIVGDVRYGAPAPLKNRQIALLARQIVLMHPTRKTPLRLVCPLPVGWPWPAKPKGLSAPFWTVDDYRRDGLVFPPAV
jgi:23S rRNA pseudouridine1911/1915/1917 synthase